MATDSDLMATVLDRLAYIYDDMQAWNNPSYGFLMG